MATRKRIHAKVIWVGKDAATGKWYACYDDWTQWGQTRLGAIAKLRKFARDTMSSPIEQRMPIRAF